MYYLHLVYLLFIVKSLNFYFLSKSSFILFPQKELFASKEGGGAEGRERKMSNSSGGSMKTKWMKALKSLKASDPSSGK